MTQTAQMTQSLSILWILNKLFTGVFMRQDQEQKIMIAIDEHIVFMAFQKTNCSLAFPWSKNIMDELHVFFTFTVNNCVWKHSENWALVRSRKLQKNILLNSASCLLPFPWSRKTMDEQHVFVAFTVRDSVWKHLENATFARLGKL